LEVKVEKLKEDFEQISKTIKEELRRFDFNRAREFKVELTKYLKNLLKNQELVIKFIKKLTTYF
jgi:sorting nexin-1/2